MEVLLAAVAVYVSSVSSWQTVVFPSVKEAGPMVGFTTMVFDSGILQGLPVVVRVIIADPEKLAGGVHVAFGS